MIEHMKQQLVEVTMDRPVGFVDPFGNTYPLNYGYIETLIGGDGEEQDVYILEDNPKPRQKCTVKIIAIVERADDVETKWVGILLEDSREYTIDDIMQRIFFIEQHFDSHVIMLEK